VINVYFHFYDDSNFRNSSLVQEKIAGNYNCYNKIRVYRKNS